MTEQKVKKSPPPTNQREYLGGRVLTWRATRVGHVVGHEKSGRPEQIRHLNFDAHEHTWEPAMRDEPYGGHAIRDVHQMYRVLRGRVRVFLEFGVNNVEFMLERDDVLYMAPLVWHRVWPLEPDTIMIVPNTDEYDRSKYIENVVEYISAVEELRRLAASLAFDTRAGELADAVEDIERHRG